MAVCRRCGKHFSVWTAQAVASGVCNDCVGADWSEKAAEGMRQAREAAEKRMQEDMMARAAVPELLDRHGEGRRFDAAGVAAWTSTAHKVKSGAGRLVWQAVSAVDPTGVADVATPARAGSMA